MLQFLERHCAIDKNWIPEINMKKWFHNGKYLCSVLGMGVLTTFNYKKQLLSNNKQANEITKFEIFFY